MPRPGGVRWPFGWQLARTAAAFIFQLLTESLVLAFAGGALALAVLVGLMNLIVGFLPADIPRINEIEISLGVLLFVFVVSTVTGLLFGIVPALQASRLDVISNLKEGSQGTGFGLANQRFRSGLVIVEFALSLVLMIGAGLLLRSFARLLEVNPGFNPQNVLLLSSGCQFPTIQNSIPIATRRREVHFRRKLSDVRLRCRAFVSAAIGNGYAVPLLNLETCSSSQLKTMLRQTLRYQQRRPIELPRIIFAQSKRP